MECLKSIFCCCNWAKIGEKTPLVKKVEEMGMLLKIRSESGNTYSEFDVYCSRPLKGATSVVTLSSAPNTSFYIGREQAKKLVAKFGIEKKSEPKFIDISCSKGGALKVSVNRDSYRKVKNITFEAKAVHHSGQKDEVMSWEGGEGDLLFVMGSQRYSKKVLEGATTY